MDKDKLEQYVKDGLTTKEIGELFNLDKRTISYWVAKYKLSNELKYSKLDKFQFNKIDSKEKAYVLGFILADGHINDKNTVAVTVSLYDKSVAEYISKIINTRVHYSHVLNTSKRKFPNAKFSKRIPDILKFTGGRLKKERHYPRVREDLERYLIQGLFDADGCITWGRRKDRNRIWQKVSFTSQLKILSGVQQYLMKTLSISTAIKPKSGCDCFILEFASRNDVLKFCEHIYPNDEFIILTRKYLTYKALRLELEENGESNSSDCQHRAEPTE